VKEKFPNHSIEIRDAGTCFSAGLHTACVFHAMRAAEIGVRALAAALQVQLETSIELTEWGVIQDKIDSKVKDLKQLPRSLKRDEDQRFYSEAAAQLRYFKAGWRIRAAHARATFNEQQALMALNHVREFFEAISTRLTESTR
jgi:hypothetical protein